MDKITQSKFKEYISEAENQRGVYVNRVFMKACDSPGEAIMLGHVQHSLSNHSDKNGWYHHTYEQWAAETCMSASSVIRILSKFKASGFLEIKTKKLFQTEIKVNHYRIDWDALHEFITTSEAIKEKVVVKMTTSNKSIVKMTTSNKSIVKMTTPNKRTKEVNKENNKETSLFFLKVKKLNLDELSNNNIHIGTSEKIFLEKAVIDYGATYVQEKIDCFGTVPGKGFGFLRQAILEQWQRRNKPKSPPPPAPVEKYPVGSGFNFVGKEKTYRINQDGYLIVNDDIFNQTEVRRAVEAGELIKQVNNIPPPEKVYNYKDLRDFTAKKFALPWQKKTNDLRKRAIEQQEALAAVVAAGAYGLCVNTTA